MTHENNASGFLATAPVGATINYTEFVGTLLKTPELILDNLGTGEVNLIHCALGVVGEAIELMDATTYENKIEELGDLEFYLQGIAAQCGWNIGNEAMCYDVPVSEDAAAEAVVVAAGALVDVVKKLAIHGNQAAGERIFGAWRGVHIAMAAYREGNGYERGATLDYNIRKLTKRYAGGYSDQAAAARADKPAGE